MSIYMESVRHKQKHISTLSYCDDAAWLSVCGVGEFATVTGLCGKRKTTCILSQMSVLCHDSGDFFSLQHLYAQWCSPQLMSY